MNATQDPQSVIGALRFIADLSAAAAECRVTRSLDDELTARRRRRLGAGPDDLALDTREVKAL